MEHLIDELISKSVLEKKSGTKQAYRLLVQPFMDHGFEFPRVRSIAKRMGMSFIQNDTKMCFQTADLKASLTELVGKLKSQ